jgi:arylsulfatase A-like enzyme
MTRLLLLAAVLVLAAGQPTLAQSKPPNVVFMIADDLGWRDLGSYGSTFYQTPHLDRLAASGTRFTSAYSNCQVCSPTRAAAMTGQYPPRTGITDYIGAKQPATWTRNTRLLPAPYAMFLDPATPNMAKLFKQAGYATFFCGKWHLGGPSQNSTPTDHGFDVNIAGTEGGGPYGKGKYLHPFQLPNLDSKPGDHLPIRLAEESIKLMKQAHAQGKPFLLYHAFYSVHTPLVTTNELKAKYEALAQNVKHDGPSTKPDSGAMVRQVQDHAVYAGMVEAMDTAAGMMIDAIAQMGIADNTIIIFTSDNGGLSTAEGSPTSNVPLRGGKGWMYEGGIRVPAIVRMPGVTTPGSVSHVPIATIDYLPTLLAAAGVPLPTSTPIDGVDLRPALSGAALGDRPLFWHYPHYGNQGGRPSAAMREGDWKLIEFYEDGRLELYNLAQDIGETENLAQTQPQRVEQMHSRLKAWRHEVGAKMPTVNPSHDPSKPLGK